MFLAGGKSGRSGPARRRNPRLLGLAIVVCLLAAGLGGSALAPSAVAAVPQHKAKKKPKLPSNFFGVSPNRGVLTPAEFGRMHRGGIRSLRVPLGWSSAWPTPFSFNWTYLDYQVAGAASAGLSVLPVVYSTPRWLGVNPLSMPVGTAPLRSAWQAFLKLVVERYGPRGAFWTAHPNLPYKPIRAWQIWNEENSIWYTEPVSVSNYARLLKLSSKAIKAADPGATVLMGGLYGRPKLPNTLSANTFLKRLYQVKGIKSSFDAVGLHPYAHDVKDLRTLIVGIRSIMKKARDGRTPLWLTEFGWGSGFEHTISYDKGPQGQRKALIAAYKMLIAKRRRWRIGRAYWFSWDDIPANEPACFYCHTSGLFTADGNPKPAWYGFVKVAHGKP